MAVTNKFKNMALSFFGCDGGNLNSSIWACGLEWGGGYKHNQIPEQDLAFAPLTAWDHENETVEKNLIYQYNQKLAWFFSYLFGWDISQYALESAKHKLFSYDGLGFKMNAFPVSFKNRDSVTWEQTTKVQTGLDNFDVYREWCIQHRGQYFYELICQHNPKLVLCTGITSSMEFFRFFKCDVASIEYHDGYRVGLTNNKQTIVMVVPFFGGTNGINSYAKMQLLVSKVDNYAQAHFASKHWFRLPDLALETA